jgi:hypothetical protein
MGVQRFTDLSGRHTNDFRQRDETLTCWCSPMRSCSCCAGACGQCFTLCAGHPGLTPLKHAWCSSAQADRCNLPWCWRDCNNQPLVEDTCDHTSCARIPIAACVSRCLCGAGCQLLLQLVHHVVAAKAAFAKTQAQLPMEQLTNLPMWRPMTSSSCKASKPKLDYHSRHYLCIVLLLLTSCSAAAS